MHRTDAYSASRRLPSFIGPAILGYAVMAGARSFDVSVDEHWWALVLVLAFGAALSVAGRFSIEDGRRSGRVVAALAAGLLFLSVAAGFAFGATMSMGWPIAVQLTAIALLSGGYLARRG